MATTFTFGFSGDDIEADVASEIDADLGNDEMQIDSIEEQISELLPPRKYSLEEIVRVPFFKSTVSSWKRVLLLVQTYHTP